MEFNNRLYQLRKQKGFSQEELANRLNVSRQTVSKWEVGDSTPDMEKLVAISGLENFIVVDTDDVLLICPKDDKRFKDFISGIAMPEYEKYR